MPKFIIVINGEALDELYEGEQAGAEDYAFEAWLEASDQDYQAVPATKANLEVYGIEEDEDE